MDRKIADELEKNADLAKAPFIQNAITERILEKTGGEGLYHKFVIDLSVAHTDERYDFSGDRFTVENIEDQAYVRLGNRKNSLIDLHKIPELHAPFRQFFITNEAGTGVLEILVGAKGMFEAKKKPEIVANPDYLLYKVGSVTKALNCDTGFIVSTNTDSEIVLQFAIDALTTGGHIHIKKGLYELDDNINTDDYITISGEGYSTELKFTTADKTIKMAGKTCVVLENFRVNGNVGVIAGTAINISGTGAIKCHVRNVISHDAGADGIGFWQQSQYCTIENCLTYDNGTNGMYIEGTGAGDSYRCKIIDSTSITDGSNGIRFSDSFESVVKGNIIFQCGATGILVDDVDEGLIANNIIFDPVNGGILASATDDILIANNQVYQTGAAHMGIAIATGNRGLIIGNVVKDAGAGALSLGASGVTVVGNSVYNANLKGLNMAGCIDCLISGNFIDECGQAGIEIYRSQKCSITNNICINNSQGAAGGNYGIKIWDNSGGVPCTNLIVTGNLCYDNQGTKTQGYGIRELDSSDYNLYAHNMLADNLTAPIAIVGANSQVIENLGYVSENGGVSDVIADGGTIAHGLATTPTYAIITGSVAGEIVNVTGLGAANLTIAIKTNAGAAGTNQAIYWRAWL